jgi:membrane-associated phospholipid phosphatase
MPPATNTTGATGYLAYANAAAFDAQIACFDAKFTYWFIRPSQADPAITLPIPLPNHPSYPSAHSCITSALMTVLIDAFPSDRPRLEGIITSAGLSRMYAGIHYQCDVEAGQAAHLTIWLGITVYHGTTSRFLAPA